MTSKLPTYFLSHGGGPWPYMPEMAAMFAELKRSLEAIALELGSRPKALLVISAHWEERGFTLSSSPAPSMIYDYGGFPPHTYRVTYPAPGSPELARRIQVLLEEAGIPAQLDPERGYDHGTFVPLAVMYPEAHVPVVQLSLRRDLDPASHLAMGRALAPLREEGVVIVGSGLSYHNLAAFGPQAHDPSHRFDAWLHDALTSEDPAERAQRLTHWSQAPAARQAHPREDHLIPLMVAVGAAEAEQAERIYHEDAFFGGIAVSSYRFGALKQLKALSEQA